MRTALLGNFSFAILITIYITSCTTNTMVNTMVSVARPWVICDYHGLICDKMFYNSLT